MDPSKLKEMASKLTEEQRRELAEKLDSDLGEYMNSMEAKSSKYMDGWNQENWEQEMENHPFFNSKVEDGAELSPLMQGMQDLKYSPEENSPEELAANYKEDGNFNFKCGKYRFAVASYSEGLKARCSDELLNTQLLSNRAAAQFRIGNFRSALIDCRMALVNTSGHRKALVKGAECCLRLRRHSECVDLCDQGLSLLTKDDEELLELRRTAVKAKAELERDERRRAAAEKKERAERRRILEAIEKRGIAVKRSAKGAAEDLELSDLEPTHPAALRKQVHFTEQGNLAWPVLFLYPEHGETDFIEEFLEDDAFADHLNAMFGPESPPAPWDLDSKYRSGVLRLYFEDRDHNLVSVDTGKSLLSVLGDSKYIVTGGTPGFIVVVDNSDFHREFVKKYN